MSEMDASSPAAAKWVCDYQPTHWATAYFHGEKFGHLTSNVAESINAWILDARGIPILERFETICQQFMNWFAERRRRASDMTGPVVPLVAKLISANVAQARGYQVMEASDTEYECTL
jgi:hypothetical protein